MISNMEIHINAYKYIVTKSKNFIISVLFRRFRHQPINDFDE